MNMDVKDGLAAVTVCVYYNAITWYYKNVCAPLFTDDRNAALMYAISMVLLFWLFVYFLDKKKIYIKV